VLIRLRMRLLAHIHLELAGITNAVRSAGATRAAKHLYP
jgi:hypothetical protein